MGVTMCEPMNQLPVEVAPIKSIHGWLGQGNPHVSSLARSAGGPKARGSEDLAGCGAAAQVMIDVPWQV